jgi:hypothetical protein
MSESLDSRSIGAWISGRKDYTARTSGSSRRAAIVLSRSANQTVAFLLA